MSIWLIYGAYGYTGQLICAEADRRDISFCVAGRNAERVQALAQQYDVPGYPVALNETDALHTALDTVDGVMHCAGPFEDTALPMVEACLATETHYLDITGEWQVFEALQQYDSKARETGITVLPGTGFDVVPTDCVANTLSDACPEATSLALGFVGLGSISRGTARTALRGWGDGSRMRQNGKLVTIPAGTHTRSVDIAGRKRALTAIPWGDVSTAYWSTQIPTIAVYTYIPALMRTLMRWADRLPNLLQSLLRPLLDAYVRRTVDGPDANARQTGASYVWGEVQAPDGITYTARWEGPEGYTLTARTSVEIMHRLSTAASVPTGYQTPATAFGADLVESVEGSSPISIQQTAP